MKRQLVISRLPDADDFEELYLCLLIQAFGGRPLRVLKPPRPIKDARWIVVVASEAKELHVECALTEADIELMLNDHDAFIARFVSPALNNLDAATFPERFERFIKAAKRSAELLPMPSTKPNVTRTLHS
jgi:hypothetical protein